MPPIKAAKLAGVRAQTPAASARASFPLRSRRFISRNVVIKNDNYKLTSPTWLPQWGQTPRLCGDTCLYAMQTTHVVARLARSEGMGEVGASVGWSALRLTQPTENPQRLPTRPGQNCSRLTRTTCGKARILESTSSDTGS